MLPVPAAADQVADEEVVSRVRAGDTACYEVLMRRYNQRLYRIARSILRDDSEAEDVMQDAYVRAFEHLHEFAGRAKFSTWLTKIAVYEALRRVRRRTKTDQLDSPDATMTIQTAGPERQAYDRELKVLLERAVEALPDGYRVVFVLRAVEGLDVAETAAVLSLGPETVKTRLHRARALLRKELQRRAGVISPEVFPFHLSRCDRVVADVFKRLALR